MKTRTSLKDLTYFEDYIQLNNEDIEYYLNELRAGSVREDRISAVNRQIFTTALHTVIAKYSAGYAVPHMIPDFIKAIDALSEGWNSRKELRFDDYILMLWVLSLGVLLHVDHSDFERIVNALKASGHQDYIYDIIIAFQSGQKQIPGSPLVFPNAFGFLKNFYEIKDTTELKKYLDHNWYKEMRETYWYESDKGKQPSFFGYWSFESAAFMKIVKLDDQFLKDQQYYPYDLNH